MYLVDPVALQGLADQAAQQRRRPGVVRTVLWVGGVYRGWYRAWVQRSIDTPNRWMICYAARQAPKNGWMLPTRSAHLEVGMVEDVHAVLPNP